MCNKITFVKLDGHDVQGPTHLNQVAPFNLKFSTISASAFSSISLKKKNSSRHNTPDEKIGRWNTPTLLLSMAAPLWEEKPALASRSHRFLYMSEQINSQRTWQYFNVQQGSGNSPIFGHLQLDYAAMETKATDNSGALKTAPHAYPFP